MRSFSTGRMDAPQCNGSPLEPVGEVELGETFVIECPAPEDKDRLGPLIIKGVKSGDVVSIHLDEVKATEWSGIGPDYGMIPEILERQRVDPQIGDYIEEDHIGFCPPRENDELVFPGDIRVPFRPMVGCISLAARERSPNPWAHGGNMDIIEVRQGATVYIRAQREGGLLALGDLHAYQGDGEIAGSAIEAAGEVTVTVDVTDRFPALDPVIEIDGKVMTVGMGLKYWHAVRSAVRDMTYLLMEVLGLTVEEAYSVAVMGGSLRNGALWMMSDHPVIAMDNDDRLTPRTVFLEVPWPRGEGAPTA